MDKYSAYQHHTVTAYNRVGSTLAVGFDRYFAEVACEEAAHVLESLSPESSILDLGCGSGPASRYFSEHGHDVVSADLSEGMLQECRLRGLSTLVRLDLEALPFGAEAFDAVWAHTSMLHIPKSRLSTALEDVVRCLKTGGLLFIGLREGKSEGYLDREGEQMWFSHFTEGEFEEYLPPETSLLRHTRTRPGRVVFLYYLLQKQTP
jgi:ubiquinone/menaquinone biosynthesis C-methylase UbiE